MPAHKRWDGDPLRHIGGRLYRRSILQASSEVADEAFVSSQPEVASNRRIRTVLPWCCLLVFIAVGIVAVDQPSADDPIASHTLASAVSSTLAAKSFIECVQSTYLPAADGCMNYHGPDQLAIGFVAPYAYQKRIYSVDRLFSSLGYGQALSGSAQAQAAESDALERADLWTESPMPNGEVVSEIHQSVFAPLDLVRSLGRATVMQNGNEYRVTTPRNALTVWVTVQHGFAISATSRTRSTSGKWTTRTIRLSKLNDAPPIQLPKAKSIVGRANGDGCVEQVIVPQCL